MKLPLSLKVTLFLLITAMFSAFPAIAQTNASCFSPGNMLVSDAVGDTILPQHDIDKVFVAEPISSDGLQKLVFTLKVQTLSPLPLASWNIMFVGPDNVTRYLQMSTLVGNPQFRYGRVTSLLGVPMFTEDGIVQGTINNNGTVSFYINKNLVGNPANGQQITVSSRVYIKPLLDLVEVDSTPSTNYSILGNAGCAPYQIAQFGINGDIPVAADYTRNGADDFAVWRPNTGVWYSNDTVTNEITTLNWGSGALGDIPVVGDFDGDSKSDFTVYRPSSGTWYTFRSSDSSYTITNFGTAEDIPLCGDFDGDRIDDIAVFRPSTGIWYILRSIDLTPIITQFGLSEDRPVQGDFDGDRKADIAVFRPSTGIWYFLKSSNGSFGAVNFGLGTDKVVPADYDGDGKTDFAVWRPETGVWYVLRSSDFNYTAFQWGLTADRVQTGDFNGNGRADYAVWRPSTGVWYAYLN
jgi:FG-GAP-like repeat